MRLGFAAWTAMAVVAFVVSSAQAERVTRSAGCTDTVAPSCGLAGPTACATGHCGNGACGSCGSGHCATGHCGGGLFGDGCGNGCRGGHCGRGCKSNYDGLDRYFNCGCNGSYNYPVPPLYTYHWPGMYKQVRMTDYHSPWRFPPIKPYTEEPVYQEEMGYYAPTLRPISHQTDLHPTSFGEVESVSSRLSR